ncbi:MAG: transglycosylase SLT domain-containing protein, partial [Gammaproteobacteria bacterium]
GSHQLKAEFADQFGIKAHFSLSEPEPHAWAVRTEDTRLLAAVNKFVKNNYRGKVYNVLHERYFEKPIGNNGSSLLAQLDRLSPYDEIVRKYAEQYSFDWRLIVAQMYQESQFDPKALSYAGAEGLMQILPTTGEDLGTSDLYNPKSSIKAGVRYLGMLRDRFEDDLLLEDRIWLSLAAYNAGYSRVTRARYLTEEMGLDKNRWFGNVEKAMLVLARPFKMEGKINRHCRCGQTVIYVRKIRTLYNNYVRLTQATQLASNETPSQSPYDI